jgi:hypothetical protein
MWGQPPYSHGAVLRLYTLAAEAAHLSADDFAASYGRGFFVLNDQRHSGSVVARTLALAEPPPTSPASPASSVAPPDETSPFEFFVLPCVRRPESKNPFVCVGRLQGNDITINDPSVSKYHAFVREAQRDCFVIQDAKSTNGTWVDNVAVAARGEGQPLPLRSGQNVRFGSVATTFLDFNELLALARRFAA